MHASVASRMRQREASITAARNKKIQEQRRRSSVAAAVTSARRTSIAAGEVLPGAGSLVPGTSDKIRRPSCNPQLPVSASMSVPSPGSVRRPSFVPAKTAAPKSSQASGRNTFFFKVHTALQLGRVFNDKYCCRLTTPNKFLKLVVYVRTFCSRKNKGPLSLLLVWQWKKIMLHLFLGEIVPLISLK